jgi:hypothetical protein
MKSLVLSTVLVLGALLSNQASSSGAILVLLSVQKDEYAIKPALFDSGFIKKDLFKQLQFLQQKQRNKDILVARVPANIFEAAQYYTYYNLDVSIDFDGVKIKKFLYVPELQSVVSVLPSGGIVVLQPQDLLESDDGAYGNGHEDAHPLD